MQLLLLTTILALCVLSVLGLPNLNNQLANEGSLESFKVELLAAQSDTRAISTAVAKCTNTYNVQTLNINNTLIAQTNKCFENTKQTTFSNYRNTYVTVTAVRKDITNLQTKLNSCSKLQDNTALLTCITKNYDSNMELLDSTNSQAHQVMAENTFDETHSEKVRQKCTNSAIGHAKRELLECATDYSMCLDKIRQN